VLATIKKLKKGFEQVITVVGCGGDRDRTKRPVMAEAACEHSDRVIFTSDNPRSEDPAQIIRDMEEGLPVSHKRKYISIVDRKEAIKTAISLAKPEAGSSSEIRRRGGRASRRSAISSMATSPSATSTRARP
jgi:UDP-N-acetylmuramoyl-L-alanyl-D-glutamate--2,6-diaminopimelate ligase